MPRILAMELSIRPRNENNHNNRNRRGHRSHRNHERDTTRSPEPRDHQYPRNSESEEEYEPEMALAIREPRRGQDQAPHRPHTSIHRGSVHGVNPHRDGPFRGGIHLCLDKRCRWSPRICRCRCAQTTNVARRSFRRATWGIG